MSASPLTEGGIALGERGAELADGGQDVVALAEEVVGSGGDGVDTAADGPVVREGRSRGAVRLPGAELESGVAGHLGDGAVDRVQPGVRLRPTTRFVRSRFWRLATTMRSAGAARPPLSVSACNEAGRRGREEDGGGQRRDGGTSQGPAAGDGGQNEPEGFCTAMDKDAPASGRPRPAPGEGHPPCCPVPVCKRTRRILTVH